MFTSSKDATDFEKKRWHCRFWILEERFFNEKISAVPAVPIFLKFYDRTKIYRNWLRFCLTKVKFSLY